jgi:DNA-binding response OmpR family regulator
VDLRAPAVLVIDDERHMRDMLEIGLQQRGFAVRCAPDGVSALRLLEQSPVDVIVLDVMMPKVDGISLLPMLRRTTEAPILMLSAKTDLATRVNGLESGADDYLPKPFEFDELAARLRSAVRRPTLREVETITYADITIDVLKHRVVRSGEQHELSAREFDLLCLLVRNPERVFKRSQLLDLVWGPDRDVLPGCVETYISYLRAKIDRPPHRRLIHTIRGVGYCLR